MRRLSRDLLLTGICLANSSTAFSTPSIFARACVAGFTQCAGLPADFCCGPNTKCVPLAANTTVLCCPAGSSCATIQPIPCDISAQNNTLHPENSLKTTALTGILPKCGSRCCPFGFTCNTGGNCVMDADQSKAPATSSVPSGTPAPTSSTPASTAQASATKSQTPSTAPTENTSLPLVVACDKFPVAAVLVGFFPGLILGILLTVFSICILGARRRKQARRNSNGSSFGNISEPQPSGRDMRTDFLRKPPPTPSTVETDASPQRRNTVSRMRSIFRKSGPNNGGLGQRTMPGGGVGSQAPPIPMSAHNNRPVTPVLQRELSYEDINIFADGDTASALRERERMNEAMAAGGGPRMSHQTTFSDMMERSGLAGLQKGQPYVYRASSGGYNTPTPTRQRTP